MSKLLQICKTNLIVDNYNDDFLILKLAHPKLSNTITLSVIGKAIFQKKFDFIEEVIVTEVEICLKLNTFFHPKQLDLLQQLTLNQDLSSKLYRLPVYFDNHEDWTTIEQTTGLDKTTIIQQLTATHFSIAMFGFLPGFIYFNGLDEALHVPRKTVPSKYIKANSIAIGGKYLGLYSVDSPGGWHVIGQIPVPILKLPNIPPIDLNLADTVQLYSIDKATYEQIRNT